jgi:hypothetical protein
MPGGSSEDRGTAPLPRSIGTIAEREPSIPAGRRTVSSADSTALREAWRAFWLSRAIVWIAGAGGVALLGFDGVQPRPESVRAFGSLGNALLAPLTGWDANSYVQIAAHGYQGLFEKAFFPLYPFVTRVVAWVVRSEWAAAAVVSLVALFLALYLLHRLTSLELGVSYARPTIVLLAFSPMAVFFSAAYTESLFLCLSVGSFYAARRERWAVAAGLGVLAAMTRNSGVLLIVPLAWLYLYGPREAPEPTRKEVHSRLWGIVRPRYRIQSDILWVPSVALGLASVFLYMGLHGDALAPLHSVEQIWHRHTLPLGGVIKGIPVAFDSLRRLVTGGGHMPQVPGGQFSTTAVARYNLVDWAFFAYACICIVGVFRRLPPAYGLYSAALLVVSASAYTGYEPLISLPRYVSGIFPCYMWLGAWSKDRRCFWPVFTASALLLILFSAQFATWHWVA